MTLTSNRLKYSKFNEDDFTDYFSLVSKLPVMRYATGKAMNLEQAQEKFKKVIEINKQFSKIGVFSVRSIENNEFIGLAKITFLKDGEAELGYSMLPKYWGKGYGTEMSTRMVELAQATPVVKKLMAIVDPENKPSVRILRKQGLSFSEKTTMDGLPAHIYRRYLH